MSAKSTDTLIFQAAIDTLNESDNVTNDEQDIFILLTALTILDKNI